MKRLLLIHSLIKQALDSIFLCTTPASIEQHSIIATYQYICSTIAYDKLVSFIDVFFYNLVIESF